MSDLLAFGAPAKLPGAGTYELSQYDDVDLIPSVYQLVLRGLYAYRAPFTRTAGSRFKLSVEVV